MSLRRLGKPVWMLQYNNEAHNLVHRRNTKDLAIRLQQFFDHYLKGEPAGMDDTGVPHRERENVGIRAGSIGVVEAALPHCFESKHGS